MKLSQCRQASHLASQLKSIEGLRDAAKGNASLIIELTDNDDEWVNVPRPLLDKWLNELEAQVRYELSNLGVVIDV